MTSKLCPRLCLAAILAGTVIGRSFVLADEPDSDLQTLLTLRGERLLVENFLTPIALVHRSDPEAKARTDVWRVGNGQWTSRADGLCGVVLPKGNFHPATLHRALEYRDAVIQLDVRLDDIPFDPPPDGANSVGLTLRESASSHLVMARVTASGLILGKVRPKDPARPGSGMMNDFERFAHRDLTLKSGEWHTLVMEVCGADVVAELDGQHLVTCERPSFDVPKVQLSLDTTRGATVRNLQVWSATRHPDWERNKKRITSGVPGQSQP